MKRYRKTIVIMTVLLSITTFSIVARDKKQENEFKNLQVYPKNVSAERLNRDMELFSRALGVDCGYCHPGGMWTVTDYAADGGHKEEARTMMRMTNELNEKYFGVDLKKPNPDQVMTCYTCHRGEEYPVIPWDTANVKPGNVKPMKISPFHN